MDWLNKLKEYAPDIAGAILSGGTTLLPSALKIITKETGLPVTDESSLKSAVESADPEVMLKLKAANNQFKLEMQRLSVDLTKAELFDVQDARKNHAHSYMPAIICCYLTLSVSAFVAALLTLEVPQENVRLIDILFGSYLTAWLSSIAYWVGTTRSSAEKDRKSR